MAVSRVDKRQIIQRKIAFIGHSFSDDDASLIADFKTLMEKLGLECGSGERPEGRSVSEKIKDRIRRSDVFVGFFTRREKMVARDEWTSSPWVIEEKGMAIDLGKPLLLFVEDGVKQIGGLQGDYEYVSFSRDKLHKAYLKTVDYVFSLTSIEGSPQASTDTEPGPDELYKACREAQKAGDFEKAITAIRSLLEAAPQNPRYLLDYGRLLTRSGSYSQAINVLQKVTILDSSTGAPYHDLGHAFDHSGKMEDALYNFQRALELDPDVPINYRCYAECLYRKALGMPTGPEKEQTLKKVLRLFENAVRIGGEDVRTHVAGYVLMIQEQLAEGAGIMPPAVQRGRQEDTKEG
jgi:hypothetical protein